MRSHHPNFPCRNQPKSLTSFLAYHFPRATHFPGYKNLPRFVKMLCLSSLCVKFQPSECINSVNFAHFSSSLNYVRGVMNGESKFTGTIHGLNERYLNYTQYSGASLEQISRDQPTANYKISQGITSCMLYRRVCLKSGCVLPGLHLSSKI